MEILAELSWQRFINTLASKWGDRHSAAAVFFKCIFLQEKLYIFSNVTIVCSWVQLTAFQPWVTQWLAGKEMGSHYRTNVEQVHWRIYASPDFNVLQVKEDSGQVITTKIYWNCYQSLMINGCLVIYTRSDHEVKIPCKPLLHNWSSGQSTSWRH